MASRCTSRRVRLAFRASCLTAAVHSDGLAAGSGSGCTEPRLWRRRQERACLPVQVTSHGARLCDVHSHHHRTLVGSRLAFGRLPGMAAFESLVGNYNLGLAAINSFPKHRGERQGSRPAARTIAFHPVLDRSPPAAVIQPRGEREAFGQLPVGPLLKRLQCFCHCSL